MNITYRFTSIIALILGLLGLLAWHPKGAAGTPRVGLPSGFSLHITEIQPPIQWGPDAIPGPEALVALLDRWLIARVLPYWSIAPVRMDVVITPGQYPVYHALAGGVPTSYTNYDWALISHEVAEMAVNPFARLVSYPDYMKEIADPVASDYAVFEGHPMADIVFPSWFIPGGRPPYDSAGIVPTPMTVCQGGYQLLNPATALNTAPQVLCWKTIYQPAR